MKITTIRYTRLRSFGNYENMQYGAEAEIAPGESADDALIGLKEHVDVTLEKLCGSRDCEREEARETTQLAQLRLEKEECMVDLDKLNKWIADNQPFVDVYEKMTGHRVSQYVPF